MRHQPYKKKHSGNVASSHQITLGSVVVILGDSPERRHGDDGVPERLRDAGELGLGHVLLGVEHDGREDDDRHRQREEQEAQL